MCSFLVSSIINFIVELVNYYQKFRGPDATNDIIINGFRFVHNLLSMTGESTLQPLTNNDKSIICLFNGEIYNYKKFGKYASDGLCIIDVYQKYGNAFVKHLDGEFAIVLLDFNKNILIATTDIFGTKPIWYGSENNEIAFSSYKSALDKLDFKDPIKIKPNTTLIFDISDRKLMEQYTVYDFNIVQKKNTYDDWIRAFDNAILKRTANTKHQIIVCMSSGYDSGIICCALNKFDTPYVTYTVPSVENIEIINERLDINNEASCQEHTILKISQKDFKNERKYVKEYCEDSAYEIPCQKASNMTDDKGSIGMSYIFKHAIAKGQKIYLSGQGGDEIYSDYGFRGKKIYKHSQFGGKFPSDLKTIFPWTSFYGGTQSSYLVKEEYISGLHGIEGRYPLLDKNVVQEFLWLSSDLKNKFYKAPLHVYMSNREYPFDFCVKIGFRANENHDEPTDLPADK